MKPIFSYKDIIDVLITDKNILYAQWKMLEIPLEDKIKIHESMYSYIVQNKINKIISDFSTAQGVMNPDIIDYSRTTGYPTLARLGIKKIAMVIPIDDRALNSFIKSSLDRAGSIEFMNFLLPSEAIDWLTND